MHVHQEYEPEGGYDDLSAHPLSTPEHASVLRSPIQTSTVSVYRLLFFSSDAMEELKVRQQIKTTVRRTLRRRELREMVPLADTTIYDMEQRGEFPQRFYLTSRCVVWDLSEVEAWLEERRRASRAKAVKRAPIPDVQLRKTRPIKHSVRA